jgi:PTH1 family peptidyl-tRNA hydrolase
MRYFKIEPERMIVVHDDADLKHGQLRLKFGGGSGGHHGIESIEQTLRTKDFHRVRVGVGRPVPGQLVPPEFLLAPMSRDEAEELSIAEQDAADAVLSIIHDGIERAMNRFNKRG